MTAIAEMFPEDIWSEQDARQVRDQRVAELEAQGFICVCETLYNVNSGTRVFALQAEKVAQKSRSSGLPGEAIEPSLPTRISRQRTERSEAASTPVSKYRSSGFIER